MKLRAHTIALAAVATAASLSLSPERTAEACGAFFAKASAPIDRRPSLSVERVLIVHDAEKQVEHFIREIVFRGQSEMFGFVVPVPSRPEVFKVAESPFNRLENDYPFRPPSKGGSNEGSRGVPGGAVGGGAPKVAILDIKKVGSFTAFVLAANDADALAKWLKDNGLSSSPENDAWLKDYVERKFFYVAFRYEPSKDQKDNGQPRAETVRITFPTPLAYYPYREPRHESSSPERDVALWMATNERVEPVALLEEARGTKWVKPFAQGYFQEGVSAVRLKAALGAEEDKLVTAASYTVQPFEDQKVSREGYGDVVFLPKNGVAESRRAAVAPMLDLLRPTQRKESK